MAGFYDDMAEMVTEVLQPDGEGGLGQGEVFLRRKHNRRSRPIDAMDTGHSDGDRLSARGRETPSLSEIRRRGTLIVATDNQITFAVPAIVTAMTASSTAPSWS
ncbi:hypothetical protein NKH98_31125 [Mesorhizobium sp. M0833]|uniref:hypothetical protein n=1 Tax=Mesorhizobium sp. M0833 TaxID=2957009 RepID=UPI0033383C66